MSRRITLTDEDIKLIIAAMENLYCDAVINPNYPERALASRQRFDQIKAKLQHPRSVKTLGVSGDGDTESVASHE